MSKTIIIRIMVPRAGEEFSEGFVGHYDMQVVNDSSAPLHFKGVESPDLVFGYGGWLDVFPGNQSYTVYTLHNADFAKCDVYKCSLTVSDSQYETFLNAIEGEGVIDKVNEHPHANVGIRCTLVPSNPFSTYVKTKTNCFRAVAVWLNLMGIDTLLKIYDQAHDPNCDYLKYSAGRMVQKFASNPAWYKAASV